jgi:tetratricopeptide (TPR) repeat protein
MTDGFPDRLTQLRTRWQGDPSSRIFLQLAEEYRHLGRVQDALEVLNSGLKEHPGYLSALVAKGRCLLELGDAEKARGVLERVVQQDATQMVANKLLVRAYLETSEPERAGQRLDLYSLLNDSDPEIEELRRRVVAMSRPPRAADGPHPEEPAERSRMDPTETSSEAEVFDLGPASPARTFAAEEDVFGLGMLPDALPAAVPPPVQPSVPPSVSPPIPPTVPPPTRLEHGESNGAEPFPDPMPEESRKRYLAGLWAERIFFLEDVAAPQEPAAGAPRSPVPIVAAAAATVTLAELYLRQGHLKEAERLFSEILAREPGNTAAREGLSRLAGPAAAAAPSPAPAAGARAPVAAAPAPAAGASASVAAAPAPAAEPVQAPPREPETEALGAAAASVAPAQPAEPARAAPREPETGRPAASAASAGVRSASIAASPPLAASDLLVGQDDPQASRKVRRAYLLRSYLARLRQPRRPHVP